VRLTARQPVDDGVVSPRDVWDPLPAPPHVPRRPGDVVRAIAAFAGPARGAAGRRREAGSRIDAFVRHNRARIAVPRADRLQPRGRAHDLQAIFDQLNASHFGDEIEARIGWGPVRGGRRRRTVKTGVYVHEAKVIRIHPTLDRREVPEFYVAAVVFHEMLHQAVPAREVNGRRIVHGPSSAGATRLP
jgi:hypothetical protein